MTEKEATENIKAYICKRNYTWTVKSIFNEYVKHLNGSYVSHTALDVIENCHRSLERLSIKALEEIRRYREIGTVEEMQRGKRYIELAKRYKTIRKAISTLEEYEDIGTVEECRAGVEKQKRSDK